MNKKKATEYEPGEEIPLDLSFIHHNFEDGQEFLAESFNVSKYEELGQLTKCYLVKSQYGSFHLVFIDEDGDTNDPSFFVYGRLYI